MLPHRVHLPDSPMWYACSLSTRDTVALLLSADDGAQVFLDGRRILRDRPGELFLLPGPITHGRLVVRVLNNAGAGGLRDARLLPLEAYRRWAAALDDRQDGHLAASLAARLMVPPARTEDMEPDQWPPLLGPMLVPRGRDTISVRISGPNTALPLLTWVSSSGQQGKVSGQREADAWLFLLPCMDPGDTLQYQVRQGRAVSPIISWALPGAEGPRRVVIWGDSQNGLDTFRTLYDLGHFPDADLVIGLGDLVGNGADPTQWTGFLDVIRERAASVPHLLIPGNHDYDGYYDDLRPSVLRTFLRDEPGPGFFLVRWGGMALLAADPNERFPLGYTPERMAWIRDAVADSVWQGAEWKVLLAHQPPYARGWPGYGGDLPVRALVEELRDRGGLDLVLSGHNHDFERITLCREGSVTLCVISGGAGGGLEGPEENRQGPLMDKMLKVHHLLLWEPGEDRSLLRAFSPSGVEIDRYTLHRP